MLTVGFRLEDIPGDLNAIPQVRRQIRTIQFHHFLGVVILQDKVIVLIQQTPGSLYHARLCVLGAKLMLLPDGIAASRWSPRPETLATPLRAATSTVGPIATRTPEP